MQKHKPREGFRSLVSPPRQPLNAVLVAPGLQYGGCSLNKPGALLPTKFAFDSPLLESSSAITVHFLSYFGNLLRWLLVWALKLHPTPISTWNSPSPFSIFLDCTYHHLICNVIFLFNVFLPALECKHCKDLDFRVFCSLLHFQYLEQYLEYIWSRVLNKYLFNERMHFQEAFKF